MKQVGVGIIGSQFISTIHAESLRACPAAEIRAVASPTPGNAEAFAARLGVARHFTDYRQMLAMPEIEMVTVGAPNDVHCQIALDAAAAGKHLVMEKPLCLNLAEADRMIAACRKAGVKLMYAEELCFAPKYVRLKQLLDSGALGRPTLVKQSEKHDGPHALHFWDVERSGGGVTMDMGCHAIEFFRDYAVEKAGSTKGWSFTIYEEAWNYGFHGEMAHFVDCVQNDRAPAVTGDDGRAVLEAIFAADESARTGRKVTLPFESKAGKPIDLWWPADRLG